MCIDRVLRHQDAPDQRHRTYLFASIDWIDESRARLFPSSPARSKRDENGDDDEWKQEHYPSLDKRSFFCSVFFLLLWLQTTIH